MADLGPVPATEEKDQSKVNIGVQQLFKFANSITAFAKTLLLAADAAAARVLLGVTATGSAAAGQIPGTITNDDAAAGNVGEYRECRATGGSSTVTISNASPAVVSWTSHGLSIAACVNFTTSGGLPTGLTVGVNYYVSSQGFGENSFSVSSSVDNALAGTSINTSSAGSGTHTANNTIILATGVSINAAGLSLTAGDWDIYARGFFAPAATAILFHPCYASISATSAVADLSTLFRAVSVPLPQAGSTGGNGYNALVPPARFSLASTTTIYLVVTGTFTTSTCQGGGMVGARRAR